jgi:23S rRNA-/tRNA-specific pseudouridylate synthase
MVIATVFADCHGRAILSHPSPGTSSRSADGVRADRERKLVAERRALAASFLAAVALDLLLGVPRGDPLALAAIDFVVFEEAHSIVVAKPPGMQVLAGVSRHMRVSLPEQLGERPDAHRSEHPLLLHWD